MVVMLASERGQIPSGISRKRNGKENDLQSRGFPLKGKEPSCQSMRCSTLQPRFCLSFTSLTNLSLKIILFPITTACDILPLKIDIPIITSMQAPRLLGVQFKAQDSDHHGHRTHTSVLSLFTSSRKLLTGVAASRREHTSRLSTIESG